MVLRGWYMIAPESVGAPDKQQLVRVLSARLAATVDGKDFLVTLSELQALIERMYSDKDRARGTPATFLWFSEEVGELAAALREGTREDLSGEFADVLAWLVTLANINDIDLTAALHAKYGGGCPGCGRQVCTCETKT